MEIVTWGARLSAWIVAIWKRRPHGTKMCLQTFEVAELLSLSSFTVTSYVRSYDIQRIPSWKLTYPRKKALLKMIFLFPRWDMLTISSLEGSCWKTFPGYLNIIPSSRILVSSRQVKRRRPRQHLSKGLNLAYVCFMSLWCCDDVRYPIYIYIIWQRCRENIMIHHDFA